MFHSGDLPSGIGLAVQQRKAVLCFVHDDSQQSIDWEHVLTSGPLAATTIASQAVMLKIRAGSQEAALLSPICTLDNTPAIIIIKNAAVQANIQANDIDTAQLQSRLESLFGSSTDEASLPGRQEATVTVTQQAASAAEQSPPPPPPPMSAPASSSSIAPSSIAPSSIAPSSIAPSSIAPSSIAPSAIAYLALPPSDGQFRLPNNAYDALREHTQQLLHQGTPHQDIYHTQLRLLSRLPILRDEVRRLHSVTANPTLSDYARDKLLRMPAAAVKAQVKVETSSSTAQSAQPAVPEQGSASPSQDPPSGGQHLANSSTHRDRGGEYVYIQPDSNQLLTEAEEESRREAEAAKKRAERTEWKRQQQDREARDRIKAEIAADREERRRLAEIRGQNERSVQAEAESEAKRIKPQTQTAPGSIRVQVRSFDGSVLRSTFKHDSTVAGDIRPFVDEKTSGNEPYSLKLILTPLPNRNIEAAEEDLQLSDLGIKGSCTLVMVPVKGYVESYSGTSSGLVRNVLGLGYGLASGAAETVWGVGRYVLGYNATNQASDTARQAHQEGSNVGGQQQTSSAKMRVHTLADQRAEERDRRGANGQLYNGNQLNFEPNRDDDDAQKRD